MVQYTTAMKLGTADTEDILGRFTRDNAQHPTYRALAPLGEACKTAFLCRYLRLPALRREIHEGLQVVENWNSVNGFIYFARGSEIASNRVIDQEAAMLCLRRLQSSTQFRRIHCVPPLQGNATWDKVAKSSFA